MINTVVKIEESTISSSTSASAKRKRKTKLAKASSKPQSVLEKKSVCKDYAKENE